jgi:hypothetical protein
MSRVALFVLAATFGCRGGEPRGQSDSGVFLPDTIGALSLANIDAFPLEFREAAAAAAIQVTQAGKDPALSFAQIANGKDDEIVIAVWPASMFGGNKPKGGGGRTLYFSRTSRQIVRRQAWQ